MAKKMSSFSPAGINFLSPSQIFVNLNSQIYCQASERKREKLKVRHLWQSVFFFAFIQRSAKFDYLFQHVFIFYSNFVKFRFSLNTGSI